MIILAQGIREFGQDRAIDALIRKCRYRGTPATLEAVSADADLANDLSAAAHLIHGSSEGRFTICLCPVIYAKRRSREWALKYGDLKSMLTRYNPRTLRYGNHRVDGEEVFFISNPGLGLWVQRGKWLGGRCMILVLMSDGAAKARRIGPHVLTWTELRKRSQKLKFSAGSETTCDLDKSRMAASEYKAASRRK